MIAGESLTQHESAAVVGAIMDGELSPVQSAGLLVALACKGESVDEIVGAARAMRDRSLHVDHGLPCVVDVVGTGGDGANTINLSTMSALVAAACGVHVAKHGNRAASSACGTADVLEATGFPLDIEPERAAATLRATHFTFLFAQYYHPAMRNLGSVRPELGVRTMFNILGPLTNPAGANVQIVGVARASLVEPIGEVLRALGVRRGAVVHGAHGLDEISGDGTTLVYSFDESGARSWNLRPADYGINVPLKAIVETTRDGCREAFLGILGGERSSRAEVVALNAALVLHVTGVEPSLDAALVRARDVLAAGEALRTYERAKDFANG